jgi:hypothetical protein
MSNTHVIQHWVGGVPASANMDDWVSAEMSTGKPLLDCVSALLQIVRFVFVRT